MRFQTPELKQSYKREAIFLSTFQDVNEARMKAGKSPIWVTDGYKLRDKAGAALDRVTQSEPGSGRGFARCDDETFCRAVNAAFSNYTDGRPAIDAGSYLRRAAQFETELGSGAGDNGRLMMSPLSPGFRDRRTFREAGSRTVLAREKDLDSYVIEPDTFSRQVIDLRMKGPDGSVRMVGPSWASDDTHGLGRMAPYLSKEDYMTMSAAMEAVQPGKITDKYIDLSIGVMQTLERRGELQDMHIEASKIGPRAGEVDLVDKTGVGICILKPGDERYTGRVYDVETGVSAYMGSNFDYRTNGTNRRAPASDLRPEDVVAVYDYVKGREAVGPDTGRAIGQQKLDRFGEFGVSHMGSKMVMDYGPYRGTVAEDGTPFMPEPGRRDRLNLDYNGRAIGVGAGFRAVTPEEADEQVKSAVDGAVENVNRRIGVDRIISNVMAHAGDDTYQPRYDDDETIQGIQADCVALLQGQKTTLLRPGFQKSDFTGEIADDEAMASEEYDADADPVYHGTPVEIVQQYARDMSKHIVGQYEPDEKGVRFDPASVATYSPAFPDSIRARDDLAILLRQSSIDPDELKCDTMAAKTLKDKLARFDPDSAHAMQDDEDRAVRGYGITIKRTLAQSGCEVKPEDIRIDKNGLVEYKARMAARVSKTGDDSKDYMTQTCTFGPIGRQDEDHMVTTPYAGQGDVAFIPRMQGTIMPAKDTTAEVLTEVWNRTSRMRERGVQTDNFPNFEQASWTADQYEKGNLTAPREMLKHFEETAKDPKAVALLRSLGRRMDENPMASQEIRAASREAKQGFDLEAASKGVEQERLDGVRAKLRDLDTRVSHPFERIKVDDFEHALNEKIAKTVRCYAISGMTTIEDPTGLDQVYKDFRDKRLAPDRDAMLEQGGMSKEAIAAQKRAMSDVVMLSDGYSEVATTANMNVQRGGMDPANDNFSGVLKLTGYRPVDVTPPDRNCPFDANGWTLPGNRVNLVKKEGAVIGPDGIMSSSGREDDMAASCKEQYKLADGTSVAYSVAANRNDMMTKNMRNATGYSTGRVAYLNVGGYGFEDGCAVSQDFAERTLAANKHGDKQADELVRMWNKAEKGEEKTGYDLGGVTGAVKAYLGGDKDAAAKLRDGTGQFGSVPEEERHDLRLRLLEKSSTRPLRIGDKIENAGNKKTIGYIVPRDADSKIGELFRDNKLDVAVDPQSLAGRAAAYAYWEGRQKTDDLHVNGETIPGAVVEQKFTITPYSAENKTHADGRTISAQQGLIFQGMGCKELVSSLYGDNERSLVKVREKLLMLDIDVKPDGSLRRGYEPHPGEERPVLPPVEPAEKAYLMKNGQQRVRFDTNAVTKAFNEQVMSHEGGAFLEVRTPLRYPDGTPLHKTPEDLRSDPSKETYMLPIPAKSVRSGSASSPSSLARKLETIAVSDAKSAYLEASGKGQSKQYQQEQAKMQGAFNQLTGYIRDHDVMGKNNMFRQSLLRNKIPGATAILTGDPETSMDTISVGAELARNLNVKDGGRVLVWRDPVIDDLGSSYTKVEVRDDLTGIAMNPVQLERYRADCDGDSVGLTGVRGEAAQAEAERLLDLKSHMLYRTKVDPETGKAPGSYETALDIKTAFREDPTLQTQYEAIIDEVNEHEKTLTGKALDDARERSMRELDGVMYACFDTAFGKDAIQFGSAKDHMMSMGKVTGVGMIEKDESGAFRVLQESGPSIKGDIGKQTNYAKYAGITYDAYSLEEDGSYRKMDPGEKKKSGVYIDAGSIVQHDKSVVTPEEQMSVQMATNIGKDIGRAGGLRQSILKVLSQEPVYEVKPGTGNLYAAEVDVSKPTERTMTSVVSDVVSQYEQVLLDSKHDADQAMANHRFVAETLPALWSGREFEPVPEMTKTGPVWKVALDDDGRPKQATPATFRRQFVDIHQSMNMDVTPEMVANVTRSMTDEEGRIMNVRGADVVRKKAVPVLALAYPGSSAMKTLYDYADCGASLYGSGLDENNHQASKTSGMVCFATQKIRDNLTATIEADKAGKAPEWAGFEQDSAVRSKSGVGCGDKKATQEFLADARNGEATARTILSAYGDDDKDPNIRVLRQAWAKRDEMDKADTASKPAEPFLNKIELAAATVAYGAKGDDSAVAKMLDAAKARVGQGSMDRAGFGAAVRESVGTRYDASSELQQGLEGRLASTNGRDGKAAMLDTIWKAGGAKMVGEARLTTLTRGYLNGQMDYANQLADRFVSNVGKILPQQDKTIRDYVDAKARGDGKAAAQIVENDIKRRASEGRGSVDAVEYREQLQKRCDMMSGFKQAADHVAFIREDMKARGTADIPFGVKREPAAEKPADAKPQASAAARGENLESRLNAAAETEARQRDPAGTDMQPF